MIRAASLRLVTAMLMGAASREAVMAETSIGAPPNVDGIYAVDIMTR